MKGVEYEHLLMYKLDPEKCWFAVYTQQLKTKEPWRKRLQRKTHTGQKIKISDIFQLLAQVKRGNKSQKDVN